MTLDGELLHQAAMIRYRLLKSRNDLDRMEVEYQHAIRSLHAAGGSMREIAEALGSSHQRIHQIIDAGGGKGALKERSGVSRQDMLLCSFCGKSQAEVPKLIAGPGVSICDACVKRATSVSWGKRKPDAAFGLNKNARASCTFCGKRTKQVEGIISGRTTSICTECLTLCREIIRKEAKA